MVSADYGANHTTSYAYDNAGNLLQTAQPAPAIIVVSLVGNQLTLAWPISPGGFGLFSSGSIVPGAPWTSVGVTNVQLGNL